MIEKEVTILNRAGLHTRPAATLVKIASKYKCDFYIIQDNLVVNGKSLIGVMTLCAEQGSKLKLQFNGEDENSAANEIVEYFNRGFDEL